MRTIILGIMLAVSIQVQAQQLSFVGLTKEEVKEELHKNYKSFSPDNSVVKQEFNYLKYVNGSQTITWIIYFSDKDICTSSKKVCDYTEYDFVLDDLNKNCKKVDDGVWEYRVDDRHFTLTLAELDWYFTIREVETKNKK